MSSLVKQLLGAAALLSAAALPMSAAADEAVAINDNNVRAMAIEVEAEVTAIDLETRQVTLRSPDGNAMTLNASDEVVKLEDVNVGDVLRATYIAALEGELREPTEEEMAEPYVTIKDAGVGEVDGDPTVGAGRIIHAVCTIEGMNRLLGTVTVLDSNGKVHVIADVGPEEMSGVTLGQTIVLTFREALALSLEQVSEAE